VPPAFQQELTAAAIDLQNEVNCPPPEEEHGDENGTGKDEGKKKGHDGETTTDITTITDTTTGEG
jgi:hypothetical protein